MRKQLVATALLLGIGMSAQAADSGIYVGGALSRSDIDTDADFFGFSYDDKDTAYKIIAGIRPFDALSFEANYVDFGKQVFDNRGSVSDGVRSEYDAQALDAFAVGYLGIPLVEAFGKIGVVYWDADSVLQGGIGGVDLSDSDSGANLAWGGGLQAHFGSLATRLEYERFEIDNTNRTELWSLGVTWTFF